MTAKRISEKCEKWEEGESGEKEENKEENKTNKNSEETREETKTDKVRVNEGVDEVKEAKLEANVKVKHGENIEWKKTLDELILKYVKQLTKRYHAKEYRKAKLREDDPKPMPYIQHPLALCKYLNCFDADSIVLAAALLHDTIESSMAKSMAKDISETRNEARNEASEHGMRSKFDKFNKRKFNKLENRVQDDKLWEKMTELSLCLYEIKNIVEYETSKKYEDYRDKQKINNYLKAFFNSTINLVYRLTKKPGQTYFNYLYDLFYDKDSINKVNIKIKEKIEEKKENTSLIVRGGSYDGFLEFLNHKFGKKWKNIIVMYSIEIKLADMIDNMCDLPIPLPIPQKKQDKKDEIDGKTIEKKTEVEVGPFNIQDALYAFYKSILLINETKTKIKKLSREEKYYERVKKLNFGLSKVTEASLCKWIGYVEKKMEEKGYTHKIKENYLMLKKYDEIGGFEKLTYPGKYYFDGTLLRYGKILTGKTIKENLGFDNEDMLELENIIVCAHRDMLGFARFVEKLYGDFKLAQGIYNLNKVLERQERQRQENKRKQTE